MLRKSPERFLISMPLIVLPLLLGGARPWLWGTAAGVFSLWLAILFFFSQFSLSTSDVGKSHFLLLAPILLYPFFQLLPLPLSIVEVLSPQRAAWLKRAEEATGAVTPAACLSYLPVDTLFSGLWYFLLALFAVCLSKFLMRGFHEREWLFRTLFAIAGFEAFFGLMQLFVPSIGPPSGGAAGTFINRNHFASFLGMIWPLQLAWLPVLAEKNKNSTAVQYEESRGSMIREKQIFFALFTILSLLALLFSRSRGGILSTLAGATVLAFYGKHRFRALIPFLAACWLITLVYAWLIGFQGVFDRFASLGEDARGRLQIYRFTWNMILDHWIVGTGPATYGHVAFLYQVFDSDLVQVSNAHGDYLQILAEYGLPVGIFIVLLAWSAWWTTAVELARYRERSRRRPELADTWLIRAGALAGSSAFLCHILIESSWQIPANQLCFVTLLVLMRLQPPNRSTAKDRIPPDRQSSFHD